MMLAIKIGFVIPLLLAGWCGFRMFQTGSIRIFDTDGPVRTIAQRDRPFVYWLFIVFFYVLLLTMVAGVAAL